MQHMFRLMEREVQGKSAGCYHVKLTVTCMLQWHDMLIGECWCSEAADDLAAVPIECTCTCARMYKQLQCSLHKQHLVRMRRGTCGSS